jgi:hypothetical protein
MPNPKPILVGESNPYGPDPRYALYPDPPGCSGYRLCYNILAMSSYDYLRVFDRVDLVLGKWKPKEARAAADKMIEAADFGTDYRAVLLGAKVCSAFGFPFKPFEVVNEFLLVLPHPSGLCRIWHEPGAMEKARTAVKQFAPWIADKIGTRIDPTSPTL